MGHVTIRILIVLTATSAASADLLVPVDQSRFVRGSGSVHATDFGPFIASVPGASQNSQILADSLIGSGAVGVNDSIRSAESRFQVTFEIAQPVEYHFSGALHGTYSTASSTSSAELLDAANHPIFFAETFFVAWDVPFDTTGTFMPGRYTMVLVSSAYNGDPIGGSAFGSFNGVLQVVPEPATLTGLGAAMIALSVWRRSGR